MRSCCTSKAKSTKKRPGRFVFVVVGDHISLIVKCYFPLLWGFFYCRFFFCTIRSQPLFIVVLKKWHKKTEELLWIRYFTLSNRNGCSRIAHKVSKQTFFVYDKRLVFFSLSRRYNKASRLSSKHTWYDFIWMNQKKKLFIIFCFCEFPRSGEQK